jgi:hypothetical protein
MREREMREREREMLRVREEPGGVCESREPRERFFVWRAEQESMAVSTQGPRAVSLVISLLRCGRNFVSHKRKKKRKHMMWGVFHRSFIGCSKLNIVLA